MLALGLAVVVAAPPQQTVTDVVLWNRAVLQSVRTSDLGPPQISRAIAIVHTCMYDAWAAYDDVAVGAHWPSDMRQPVAVRTEQNARLAAGYAAYMALSDLFPGRGPAFAQVLRDIGSYPGDKRAAANVGRECAIDVLEDRHADGSNQLNGYADTTGYEPVNTVTALVDPSHWRPLRFANGNAPMCVTPHWGSVHPFGLDSGGELRPTRELPQFGSEEFREQAQEIVDLTANLTMRQKVVAEYWADGPNSEQPPGHWCLFAQQVSARDGNSFEQDIKLFMLVGNTVMDAGIAAWDCKIAFDYARPVTAIRALWPSETLPTFNGGRVLGRDWVPYQDPNFLTPPFPEYVSGHSTFSSAAAEVLRGFTGSDAFGGSWTAGIGWSDFERGFPPEAVTLKWATFTEAAHQAGMSRRWGGIHFKNADLDGRAMGKAVGERVLERGRALFAGQRQ